MAIAKEEALRLANDHAAKFKVAEYRTWHEFAGRVPEGWLFTYRYSYINEIAPGAEHRYALAGAGGFLVAIDGTVQDLTVPNFIEAERHRIEE